MLLINHDWFVSFYFRSVAAPNRLPTTTTSMLQIRPALFSPRMLLTLSKLWPVSD